MNEIIDKLILLIVTTVFMSLTLILYRYAHALLYPSSRQQIFKRFHPSRNSPDTIHLFSRILGVGIIYSQLGIYFSDAVWLLAFITFLLQAVLLFSCYLISIYIIESIVFYNFEYIDEILKRKNYTYAIISFSHSIAVAWILKTIIMVSENNFIMIIMLWLISMVIMGLSVKSYSLVSKLAFNKLLIQKNLALAFSYSGFVLGWTMIISSSINNQSENFLWFNFYIVLKILLSVIIFPIFNWGLITIFKLQDDFKSDMISENGRDILGPQVGYGIFEGIMFLTSCLLTTVITGKIYFGSFYPGF